MPRDQSAAAPVAAFAIAAPLPRALAARPSFLVPVFTSLPLPLAQGRRTPVACAPAAAHGATPQQPSPATTAATTTTTTAATAATAAPLPPDQYVPLHVHSDFSLLDGASQLPPLVARAAALAVPALALTDHGVLYGAVQLVRLCRATTVKPIIGNEMYVVNAALPLPTAAPDAASPSQPPPKRFHLIVLAKNTAGYRNLVRLTTMAHLSGRVGKGIFQRPCVNKEQLRKHREGLIVSSACLGGEIAQAILNDDIDEARRVATWFRDVFADDFYLEIQDHGSAEDKKVNPVMLGLAEELGVNLIATNDSHFTDCLDAEAHDALVCIQTGKLLTDEKRLRYAGNEYFKSVDEMRQCFIDHLPLYAVDEALRNTLAVAEKVDEYHLFGATRIPDFPVPTAVASSHDDYLQHVAREGMRERFAARLRSGLIHVPMTDAYERRLEDELQMICRMGFASYFLVVWDYIRYARAEGIPVGPGRGSAAGSLVAFALRITDVDPMVFNLLFERFLNPERKSMPDIDTDFSIEGREKVIAYVSRRYGADRVAQIITFNRLTSKAVLKDVARVHNVPYSDADRLAKMIPVVRGKPAKLSEMLSDHTPSKDFRTIVEKNPGYKEWLDKAQRIEGANKTYGIHAAGVVISASPLSEIVPLSRAKHGETITQYAMEDVESLGLLKMDFLGLKNLSVIDTTLTFVNEGRRLRGLEADLDFSVDGLPLDDAKTYKLLAEGELDGIFQLDASAGMRSIVRELRPTTLEDISSILALYRPGPLDAGLIPKFIRRKHGVEPITYDHPLLEPILKDTYGIMVYQEQIMRIARDLAGYSLGQADILRRAMGKKKMQDMEREKPKFVAGAVERGIQEETAVALFDQMTKFAEYCFNKSHSTAYAYLTYQTAYLKANYPVEYSAALLRLNTNVSDKLVRYLADANALGVKVLPPSLNKSAFGFTVDRSGQAGEAVVLFGLEAVKSVGESVASALIEEREARGPFRNIIELIERVNLRVLNKRAVGALIQAGTFDELHPNRKALLNSIDSILALRRKLRDKRKRRETKGLSDEEAVALDEEERLAWEEAEILLTRESENNPDYDMLERLAREKATVGFYASGNPLYDVQHVRKMLQCTRVDHVVGESIESGGSTVDELPTAADLVQDGAEVMILSCVTDLKKMTTAKGKKMAKWTIEDATGRVAAIVFPESYEIMEQQIEKTSSSEEFFDLETNPESAMPEFVVKEDARVIVWGKVDRESSGTAQVIVDDVQRVEDVQVLLATVRRSESYSPSMNAGMLRDAVARALGVDRGGEKSMTYIDPNGIVRRRRQKKGPALSERNRIPMVFNVLDENDQNPRAFYAGNRLRVPTNCFSLLADLREKPQFSFSLLSVGNDLMKDSESREAVFPTAFPSAGDNCTQEPSFSNEDRESEQSSEESANKPVEIATRTDRQEKSALVDTNSPENEPESGSGLRPEVAERILQDLFRNHEQPECVETVTEHPVARPVEEKTVAIGDVLLSPAQSEEVQQSTQRWTKTAGVTTKPLENAELSVGEGAPPHNGFYVSTFFRSPSLSDCAPHKAFRTAGDEPSVVADLPRANIASLVRNRQRIPTVQHPSPISSSAPRTTNGSDYESSPNGSEGVGSMDLSTASSDDGLANGGTNHSTSIDRMCTQDAKGSLLRTIGWESNGVAAIADRVMSSKDVTVPISRNEDKPSAPTIEENADVETTGADADNAQDATVAVGEELESYQSPLKQNSKNAQRVAVEVDAHSVTTENPAAEVSRPPLWAIRSRGLVDDCNAVTDSQVSYNSLDLSHGIVLKSSEVSMSNVLDTFCVVASEVAWNHGARKHTVTAVSRVCLEKLTEDGVELHVTGNLAFAHGNDLYVLVDVRETKPSGKRKRVRSFGPAAVVLTNKEAVESVPLKTKKAKKSVDTVVQKMHELSSSPVEFEPKGEGNVSTPLTTKRRPRSKKPMVNIRSAEAGFVLLHDEIVDVSRSAQQLRDGGEVLAYMARAAEVCAGRAVSKLCDVRVVSLEGVVAKDAVVWESVQDVTIRTHVRGVAFGTLYIQVDCIVVDGDGRRTVFAAVFRVTCEDAKIAKKMRIVDEEEPLFGHDVLPKMFATHEEQLKTLLL